MLAFMLLVSAGGLKAQKAGSKGMQYIDSLISATHHYDARMVKVDTSFVLKSKKVSEHFFIDTAAQVLERAVVQLHHTPERSTIEYYFFVNNALTCVQSQEFSNGDFSNTHIYYFDNNTPLDCTRKDKALCKYFVAKATAMLQRVKASRRKVS